MDQNYIFHPPFFSLPFIIENSYHDRREKAREKPFDLWAEKRFTLGRKISETANRYVLSWHETTIFFNASINFLTKLLLSFYCHFVLFPASMSMCFDIFRRKYQVNTLNNENFIWFPNRSCWILQSWLKALNLTFPYMKMSYLNEKAKQGERISQSAHFPFLDFHKSK